MTIKFTYIYILVFGNNLFAFSSGHTFWKGIEKQDIFNEVDRKIGSHYKYDVF